MGNKGNKENKDFEKKGNRNKFDCTSVGAANHIEWYSVTPGLLRDSASLNFTRALGLPIYIEANSNINNWISEGPSFTGFNAFTSGILALDVAAIPGVSGGPTSAVNVAANDVYSFVRHANSGSANYDAPDLMLYMLAVDQAYMIWSHLCRAYGVARLFTQKNRFLPSTLLRSMGFDPDDVHANLANLRYFCNFYASKMSVFHVPTTLPIFQRHTWLFTNVFKDREDDKAQMILFRPSCYYTYDEFSGAGQLVKHDIKYKNNEPQKTIEEWITIANEILDPIIVSEDMQIMSGDILKAYGSNRVFSFADIPTEYTVVPTYDMGVLTQIHNATIMNGDVQLSHITQEDNGVILFNAYMQAHKGFDQQLLLNLPFSEPTPEDVMRATRLSTAWLSLGVDDTNPQDYMYKCITAGSEIVTGAGLYYYTGNNLALHDVFSSVIAIDRESATVGQWTTIGRKMALVTQVDWCPKFSILFRTSDPSEAVLTQPIFDMANYTVVSTESLDRMHETAILSEYGVPAQI